METDKNRDDKGSKKIKMRCRYVNNCENTYSTVFIRIMNEAKEAKLTKGAKLIERNINNLNGWMQFLNGFMNGKITDDSYSAAFVFNIFYLLIDVYV